MKTKQTNASSRVRPFAAALLAIVWFAVSAAAQNGVLSGQSVAEALAAARVTGPLLVREAQQAPACKAAFETPVYAKPAADTIALGSLLEGAGYGASSNSDWTDIAAGNFCGGAEKELVVVKNAHSNFSILRGPTPYPVSGFDSPSNASQPWRAVTAGNLDKDPFDEIVAIRNVTAKGVADLVVVRADPKSCGLSTVLAQATLGNPGNSDWIDAAVGNFDGKGKKIALLKGGHSNLYLVQYAASTLTTVHTSDLDTNTSYPWKALAAGDLDGDGIDELVAARQVGDGKGTTVLVYKWAGSGFKLAATSTFGNTGNSAWSGMTIGDFNADKRGAIVLAKNAHSNFAVLDLAAGTTTLRVAATSDLDSVAGQDWRGVTATDWLGADSGAAELVAVRAARAPYRADLFVYGNPYHRVQRDTGLAGAKAEFDQFSDPPLTSADLAASLTATHTNTVSWTLTVPGDYTRLVDFLETTKSYCVDGRQLRVWATLIPPANISPAAVCQRIEDSKLTAWNEFDYFREDPKGDPVAICKDYLGWASVFGRLAQQYPHFVAVEVDDFMNHPELFPEELVAEMQSRMRTQAPWMNFLPETYSNVLTVPDIARTVDTLLFYFRNDMHSHCIDGACGENSVWNAPAEIAYVSSFLPVGRKLQVGTYWGTLGDSPPLAGTARYDFDLMRLILNLPGLGGTTAYPVQRPDGTICTEFNFTGSKYCILQRLYGGTQRSVTHIDLTALSGAPAAAGEPFGYLYAARGVQNIVYRATDGHAHELWRTSTGIGTSDLTALAGAPAVVGDVRAYVYDAAGTQNVVYRGTDNNVHGLYWTTGAVGHDNLTALAHAPLAAGAPYPYVYPAANTQNVLYRGTDGHVHGLYWTTGAVGHDNLTALAHAANAGGDPSAYLSNAFGTQNAMYRGTDGHLHDLFWSLGAVRQDDLTALSHAPAPWADARAYISTNDNLQHAIYGGIDGHVHELYWSTGPVGHDDLTNDTHAPAPARGGFAPNQTTPATPSAFFVAGDGTQHVVYRDTLNHIRELSWTTGGVADDDLTGLSGAPLAAGDPSAYIVPSDGSRHVVYRSADGHIHELLH